MAMRDDSERGANLVEFAILAPLLIILVFGIIEFSWVFAQNLAVRAGAREASRITAVDFGNGDAIAAEVCSRSDFLDEVTLVITSDGSFVTVPPEPDIDPGDEVTTEVLAPITTLTGLFDTWLPLNLSSTVSIRVEQGAPNLWANGTYVATC